MPFLSLREDSFPWLVSTKYLPYQSNALDWNIGAMYCVQLTSSIIRINKRTIQWFILGQTSSTESWPYILNTQNMPGWNNLPCTPIAGALCETQDESKMLLFPNSVVDLPLNLGDLTLPQEMRDALESKILCSSPNANRELKAGDKRYEISLCDLVDNNLEFVYKPSQKKIVLRSLKCYIAPSSRGRLIYGSRSHSNKPRRRSKRRERLSMQSPRSFVRTFKIEREVLVA